MNDKKKKVIFLILLIFAFVILIASGATFAYFNSSISSEQDAISVQAAIFRIDLVDDLSLLKSNIIPSEERFVNKATIDRIDGNSFIKPIVNEVTGETETAGTACIDDNLNEICSIYSFTISNTLTDMDLPLYIFLDVGVNTFENLYFKVINPDGNELIPKTHLVDDREYTLDGDTKVYAEGSTISPVVLTNLNTTLNRAIDEETPTSVTYHLIMWIDENFLNQNNSDGGKIFASTLRINASGPEGNGITGMFSSSGIE